MKKMMVVGLVLVGILSGCEKETIDKTNHYALTDGLEDCRIYTLHGDNGGFMQVIRCPNSSTSTHYKSGKTSYDVTVIEGEHN